MITKDDHFSQLVINKIYGDQYLRRICIMMLGLKTFVILQNFLCDPDCVVLENTNPPPPLHWDGGFF